MRRLNLKPLLYYSLVAVLVLWSNESVAQNNGFEETKFNERTLIGYSNKHTVRSGETIEFKLSGLNGGQANAQLVQIINGDSISKYREHFKVEPVKSSFDGKIDLIKQELHLGSYVNIDNISKLDKYDDFTIGGYFYPTFLPSEYVFPETIDPFSPPSVDIALSLEKQTLFSRMNVDEKLGWALQLDKGGQLIFVQGNGKEIKNYPTDITIKTWDWSYIALGVESKKKSVTIHLMETPWSAGDQFVAQKTSVTIQIENEFSQSETLRIAALSSKEIEDGRTFAKPTDVFTGRIQDIRFFNKQLSDTNLEELKNKNLTKELLKSQISYWNFSKGIGTGNVFDDGKLGLNGKVVNVPERAVRGIFWDKQSVNWQDDIEGYNAIHFFADDLADAEWKTSFSYRIPESLKSGIYAAKITQDGFDEYITFFVAAPKNKPTAKIALWMSDFNYLAYSNISIGVYAENNYPGHSWNKSDAAFLENNKPFATGGVYNKHVDGSYYSYATRLKPDLGMKPNGILAYNFVADTHISSFLEAMKYEYNIITDEIIHEEGIELLSKYPVVISSTHPEYPSAKIYDAMQEYTNDGGRFMYIGANGFFWNTDLHPTNKNIFESRNFAALGERYLESGIRGGLTVEVGKIPWSAFGVHTSGMVFTGSSPYKKTKDAENPRAKWMFNGTIEGDTFGQYGIDQVRGGAAGFEVDAADYTRGTPRNALILAEGNSFEGTVEDIVVSQLPLAIFYHPSEAESIIKASMTFFETPNGGAVFTTGSITWISSTLENNYQNDVAIITKNIIDRFLDPTPFPKVDTESLEKVNRLLGNPEYDEPNGQHKE
jgi:N,N-dimethylformamidase